MKKQYKVGIVGATGMVGQRFALLLENHPWFRLTAIAASGRNKGKTYAEAVEGRWKMTRPIPQNIRDMVLLDATADAEQLAASVDFIFCAVDMPKDEIRALEERYAKLECPVCSNNSAHRLTPDVPMLIPEVNPQHAEIIHAQRKRLGTTRGFIAAKSNCSIQSYVGALSAVWDLGVEEVAVCTYQAISGAGKTFEVWPEMVDNVIPYIGGEDEKSEVEPMKVWGHIENGVIVPAVSPKITAQCIRVPVSDGHMAAAFVKLRDKATKEQIIERWRNYKGRAQELGLPSAPEHFLTYFDEPDRPQTRLDRDLYGGMGITIGRLREDPIYDFKFVSLAHNTLRGAAGGNVLMAEFLCAEGYI